jgi:hypothetical protein
VIVGPGNKKPVGVVREPPLPFSGVRGENKSWNLHIQAARTPDCPAAAFIPPGALRLRFPANPNGPAHVRPRGPRRLRTPKQIRMGGKANQKQPLLPRKTGQEPKDRKVQTYIHAQGDNRSRRRPVHRPHKSQHLRQSQSEPPPGHANAEQPQQEKIQLTDQIQIQRCVLEAAYQKMGRSDKR